MKNRLSINPVLLRELRVKMRGWKSPIIITSYSLIVAVMALFTVFTTVRDPYKSMTDTNTAIGAYSGLAILQFILIMFIAPSLTAGAISGEMEKQTLDLLLSTKLKPRSIILGKLLASISHIIILIFASLPIFFIVFLFGAISIVEILQLYGFYIIIAITFGAIGIFYSTYFKKTSVANILTYGTIAFLALGTLIANIMYYSYYGPRINYQFKQVFPLLYVNPLAGFTSLITEQFGGAYYGLNMFGLGSFQYTKKSMILWKGNLMFNICLAVLLIVLSIIKIKPIKKNYFRLIMGKIKGNGSVSFKSKE